MYVLSPYNGDSNANVFIVNSNGNLGGNNVNNTFGLRPISLLNSYSWLRLGIVELGYKISP